MREPETTWQDIASAPKDGTFVLLWSEAESECAMVGYFYANLWLLAHSDGSCDPTHWMPLPPPPPSEERTR